MLYASLPDIAGRIAAAPPANPLERKVGIECEVQGSAREQANALRLSGLAHPNGGMGEACPYHCSNRYCGEYIVHPQRDGSITGVEAIIGGPVGTPVNSPDLHNAIERTAAVLTLAGATTDEHNGGHVHVDRGGLPYEPLLRIVQNAIALQPKMKRLMAGQSLTGIRRTGYGDRDITLSAFTRSGLERPFRDAGYGIGDRGSWMWFSRGTVEFRGWNASLLPWRMAMSAYVSAAFVQAAVDGRDATADMEVLDYIDGYLPHYIKMLVIQQDKYMAGVNDLADEKEIPSIETPVNPLTRTYKSTFYFPGTSFSWVQEFQATTAADASRQAVRWLAGREPAMAVAAGVDSSVIRNARVRSRVIPV